MSDGSKGHTFAFARDSRGQILVLTAVALPVLLGIAALALDVGFMYDYRRRAQTAADAAAMSAALHMITNPSATNADLTTVARQDASYNGFSDGVNDISVTLHRPPISGHYAGDSSHLQVLVTRPTPTFLAVVLGRYTMDVGAAATAGLGSANGCLYALRQDPGVKSLEISNTKVVDAANCDAFGNGKLFVDGDLTVNSVSVAGAREGIGTVTAPAGAYYNTGQYVTDPLAYLPWPTECTSWGGTLALSGTMTYNLPAAPNDFGCWDKIEVAPYSNITLGPGRYHAQNGVFLKGPSNTQGAGLTFFLHNDKMEIVGDAQLRAPVSGTYAGILMFVHRTAAKDVLIANTSRVNLNGTIYSQQGKILFAGITTGVIDYSIFVAGDVFFADSGLIQMNVDLSSLPGGGPIRRIKLKD